MWSLQSYSLGPNFRQVGLDDFKNLEGKKDLFFFGLISSTSSSFYDSFGNIPAKSNGTVSSFTCFVRATLRW